MHRERRLLQRCDVPVHVRVRMLLDGRVLLELQDLNRGNGLQSRG